MPEDFKLTAINSSSKALIGRQKGHPESCDVFINPKGTWLGRGVSEGDFKIPPDQVSYSTQHCQIKRDSEGQWIIFDKSTNGTFIKENNQWVRIGKGKTRPLSEGTLIRLSQAVKNQVNSSQHIPLEYKFESILPINSQNVPIPSNGQQAALQEGTTSATPEKRKHEQADEQHEELPSAADKDDAMPSSGKAKRGRLEAIDYQLKEEEQLLQKEEQSEQEGHHIEHQKEEQFEHDDPQIEEHPQLATADVAAIEVLQEDRKKLSLLLKREREQVSILGKRLRSLQELHEEEFSAMQQSHKSEIAELREMHDAELTKLRNTVKNMDEMWEKHDSSTQAHIEEITRDLLKETNKAHELGEKMKGQEDTIEMLKLDLKDLDDSLRRVIEEKNTELDRCKVEAEQWKAREQEAQQVIEELRERLDVVSREKGGDRRNQCISWDKQLLAQLKEAAEQAKITAECAQEAERAAMRTVDGLNRALESNGQIDDGTEDGPRFDPTHRGAGAGIGAVVPSFDDRWQNSKGDEPIKDAVSPGGAYGGRVVGTQVQDVAAMIETVPPTAEKNALEEEEEVGAEEDADDVDEEEDIVVDDGNREDGGEEKKINSQQSDPKEDLPSMAEDGQNADNDAAIEGSDVDDDIDMVENDNDTME